MSDCLPAVEELILCQIKSSQFPSKIQYSKATLVKTY